VGCDTVLSGTTLIKTVSYPTKPRYRWEDNIKMDLQEVGCEGIDWIDVAQDRHRWWAFVNAVSFLQVP
jgi:hypothetical protein